MKIDIAEELKTLSSHPLPNNDTIATSEQLIDDSALPRINNIEKKLDVLITVQKFSMKSHDDTCKHLRSVESRLETVTESIQLLFS